MSTTSETLTTRSAIPAYREAPLEAAISADPQVFDRAQRVALFTIPRTTGPQLASLDIAAAIFAVIILLAPLAMAAWGAHHGV